MLYFNPFPNRKLFFRPFNIKSNSVSFSSWVHVQNEDTVVIIGLHDLTAEEINTALPNVELPSWLTPVHTAVISSVRTVSCFDTPWEQYKHASSLTRTELEKTGKISGYKLLVGTTLVWASTYDVRNIDYLQSLVLINTKSNINGRSNGKYSFNKQGDIVVVVSSTDPAVADKKKKLLASVFKK